MQESGASGHSSGNADRLSQDEMAGLFARAKAGDEGAREKLILGNQGLVFAAIRQIKVSRDARDEAASYGYAGLIKAVDQFDPSLGNTFATFAHRMIEVEMYALFQDLRGLQGVPSGVGRLLRKVEKARREMMQASDGREPAFEEIAAAMNLSEAERFTYQQAAPLYEAKQSLDAVSADGERAAPELADQNAQAAGEALAEREASEQVAALLSNVDASVAEVMLARFGIGVAEPMTMAEAMERLGKSKVEVRRIEAETLQRLHEAAIRRAR